MQKHAKPNRCVPPADKPPRPQGERSLPVGLLCLCCIYPAALTFVAFSLELGYPASYAIGKVVMVLIPLAVWRWKRLPRTELFHTIGIKRTTLLPGLAGGILFASVIILLYLFVFRDRIDPRPVIDKVRSLDIMDYYWFMALFLSLGNSLMEEYYWRAFLYGAFLRRFSSLTTVCLLNGALFGLHHIFPLSQYFPIHLALLFTAGTMAAGTAWSFLRAKGYSIFDCYLSHILADLAIFYAGWNIMQQGR